ncbi:unnamed protein product, partial [Medioppia subpectinata]
MHNRLSKKVLMSIAEKYLNMAIPPGSGIVRGQTIRVLNKYVDQYLAIPYAEAPIGERRFAKPVPISTPKREIIDATKPGNSCQQPPVPQYGHFFSGLNMNEDCLVLNIWAPYRQQQTENEHDKTLKP